MSGSPKFSEAEIAEWKQKILAAQRQRQAAIETQRRKEAEEQERQRQLEESRNQIQIRIQRLLSDINWQWTNFYIQDAVVLQNHCQNQQQAIVQADSEIQLLEISEKIINIEQTMQGLLQRKRRKEAEKKRKLDIERQQFELEELERRIAAIPDTESLKFDAAGRQQLQQVLHNVRQTIAAGDPVAVRRPLTEATALVQKHQRQIVQGQTNLRHAQAQTKHQLTELKISLTGLKADPVIMQWQGAVVAELEAEVNAVQQAIFAGQNSQVVDKIRELRERCQTILATANTAQLQADKRDYIADSIAETLQEMGFSITFHQPEHPEHPATSVIVGATNNIGKGISVSVPMVGKVFYDVDGYAKHSMTTVDGNSTTVCDEAEQMLNGMHNVLEDKFGVKMGEVWWTEKDPKRTLRQAENLPHERQSRSRSK